MITAFMSAGELHAVHVIRQQGMTKIRAIGLCKIEDDAGNGVFQVPDWALDSQKYVEIPVCSKCAGMIRVMKVPPK